MNWDAAEYIEGIEWNMFIADDECRMSSLASCGLFKKAIIEGG